MCFISESEKKLVISACGLLLMMKLTNIIGYNFLIFKEEHRAQKCFEFGIP